MQVVEAIWMYNKWIYAEGWYPSLSRIVAWAGLFRIITFVSWIFLCKLNEKARTVLNIWLSEGKDLCQLFYYHCFHLGYNEITELIVNLISMGKIQTLLIFLFWFWLDIQISSINGTLSSNFGCLFILLQEEEVMGNVEQTSSIWSVTTWKLWEWSLNIF